MTTAFIPPFICHCMLADLRQLVMDRYQVKGVIPEAITQMLPCVDDALEDGEGWYVEFMYALFSIVVEEYILWRKV